MPETIESHVQRAVLDAKVELFTFDLTLYGDTLRRFVNDVHESGQSVAFDGITYDPLPIRSEGWQRSGRGTLPRPTLTVSNRTGLFSYLNLLFENLVGVRVTRVRTYKWALDGEPGADPEAIQHPIDYFEVRRKAHQDNETCQYELAAQIDLEGRDFPSRIMSQNYCPKIYRRWDASTEAFDYSKATCRYTGGVFRDTLGRVVTAAQDRCAKTLPECVARFGSASDLDFAGFPGIDRVRA